MDKHLLFLANINGNGLLDISGFGNQHVFVMYNSGDGTFLLVKAVLADFCYDNGWCVSENPQFIAEMQYFTVPLPFLQESTGICRNETGIHGHETRIRRNGTLENHLYMKYMY